MFTVIWNSMASLAELLCGHKYIVHKTQASVFRTMRHWVAGSLTLLSGLLVSGTVVAAMTVTINSNAPYTNSPNVGLNVANPCSGAAMSQLVAQNSGGSWLPLQSTSSSWTLDSENGLKTVNVQSTCYTVYYYQCNCYSYCVSYDLWGNCNGYGTSCSTCQGYNSYNENASDDITLDTTPPSIVTTSPLNNSYGVPVSIPSIAATFSEAVQGVNSSTFTVNKGATGTVSYDAGSKTAIFTLSSPLALGTTYTASILALDLAGNNASYQWSFTTPPWVTVTDSVAPNDDRTIDFGAITVGTAQQQTVYVKNNGTNPVVVASVGGNDSVVSPFSIVQDGCSGQTLSAGATCMISVRFVPVTTTSSNDSFDVAIADVAPFSFTVNLTGTGLPVPAPHILVSDSVAPNTDLAIDFGSVMIGQNQEQTVAITNTGNANLALGQIASASPLSAPFSVTADSCSNTSIAPSASCTLTVRFAPSAVGTVSGTFDIPSNDPNIPTLGFTLNGNGTPIPVPHIAITDSMAPEDDLQLPFGEVTVQQTSEQVVTISNTGTADLVIGAVGAVDALTGPYSLVGDTCSGQTLLPSASCAITIRYAPTVTGITNDSFSVPSNDNSSPLATVGVSGSALTQAGNNDPSAPTLTFPADKQVDVVSPVTFSWQKSSDPDGDTLSYELYVCTSQDFSGCSGTAVAMAGITVAPMVATLGGLGGFAIIGSLSLITPLRRRRIPLVVLTLVSLAVLLAACSGGGGGSNGATTQPATPLMISEATTLDTHTTYYWKVVAIDSKGSATSSAVWSFSTQ